MNTAEKLVAIAEKSQAELNAVRGMNEELENVLYNSASGGKSYYDAFWDAYQQNGNRTSYYSLFAWGGWNGKTFKPKYNMQPIDAGQMFYQFNRNEDGNDTVNLVELLNNAGVSVDFSRATSLNYCFQNAKVRQIGVVDLSSCKNVNTVFANTYWLNKIDKIIVNENNVFDTNCFLNCEARDITFEGVLTSNLRIVSPLNKASLVCFFDHDNIPGVLSSTTSGKTLTLSKSAVQKAFETSSGANNGNTSEEWLTLAATKSNWTITLA